MSSTNYSPSYQGSHGRAQSTGSNATNDEGAQILSAFYTRTYPSADELAMSLDQFTEGELDEVVTELRNEVAALREETEAMRHQVEDLRVAAGGAGQISRSHPTETGSALPVGVSASLGKAYSKDESGGGSGGGGDTSLMMGNPARGMSASASSGALVGASVSATLAGNSSPVLSGGVGGGGGGGSGTRRGQVYRRKSATAGDMIQYVRVEDKMKLLEMEMVRVREQEVQHSRELTRVRDVLVATAEEASRRMKELRLEVMQLHREVLDPDSGEATADELVRYLHRRQATQRSYLDKIQTQCESTQLDIRRAQAQARQRRAAGEGFQPIDFDQLRIENQQFTERLEKKNAELAELKAMSTRTVQNMNALTDALNAISSEQARLKRESKSRSEYLTRCRHDVQLATKEAAQAEKKNTAIRSQQEAVKVPKIEEYIAQKAELYELEKALNNWRRKVEIAEGQVTVARQQTRKLTQQQKQAESYAESRRNRSRKSLASHSFAGVGVQGVGADPHRCVGVHGGSVDPRGMGSAAANNSTTSVRTDPGAPRGRGRGGHHRGGKGGRAGPRAQAASSSPVATSQGFAADSATSMGNSSVMDGPSPRYIPHTPSAGEAAVGAQGRVASTASTPVAGKSNSTLKLSSQVVVGGAGKAVLEAKRTSSPVPVAAAESSNMNAEE